MPRNYLKQALQSYILFAWNKTIQIDFFRLLHCTKQMKFSVRVFFNKCDTPDLVTYTSKISNRKLHFLCSATKAIDAEI